MSSIKKNLVVAFLSGAMLASSAVFADFDPKFYVGAEVQGNQYKSVKKFKFKDTDGSIETLERDDKKTLFKKAGAGISGFVGTRLNEFVGVEAGYTHMLGGKFKKITLDEGHTAKYPKVKHRNLHADVLGYVPVADCVDLIGSVGLGRLSSKISGNFEEKNRQGVVVDTDSLKTKSNKTGLRLGAGVAYKFDENLSARLMLRHQKGNKFIKNVTSAGLGLVYQF